jgi:enamine deaminase RidA (YjgF/YER057c/UK114 family)
VINRFDESGLMSQVVSFGPFVETAGQVASDPRQNIEGQTRQALASIDKLLDRAGASKSDLTRVQIWLANINDFDTMNSVYRQWLGGVGKPVRACVESKLVSGGYLIEVQAFAYRMR